MGPDVENTKPVPRKKIPVHELKLHESTYQGALEIIRVPGGWLYSWVIEIDTGITMSTTFVPYSNEFNPEKFTLPDQGIRHGIIEDEDDTTG